MKIAITGGTGFIGTHLVSYLEKKGHELRLLSRQLETAPLEGTDLVINLAGETIFGRWSEGKKERIRSSRIETTHSLCNFLLNLKNPPPLYIGASAMGYYGDRKEETLTEESSPGNDFMAQVCVEWEGAAAPLVNKNIRTLFTRFGIVLGDGGALKYMEKSFRMGMGGYLGDGKQLMSWIAVDDLSAAIEHLIHHQEISGPVNFAAPEAVTNQEFAQTLGKLLHRPTFAIPKFALSMLFGEGAEIFLSSTHIYPKRLLDSGFQFHYPTLEQALKKYLLAAV